MAKSYSDKETERKLAELEKRIKREYARAYAEMTAKAQAYFDKLEERYDQEFKAYKEGKYTDAQFRAWYQTQVERGKGYEKMKDDLSWRLAHANEMAAAYINDDTPSIFSLNHNYQAYEINQAYRGVSFQLYNEQAVKRLIEGENHSEFRTVKTDPKRDYAWNKQQIQSAITSAILTGKSMPELRDSFLGVMKRNRAAAMRNARTAYTSAQNGGRQTAMNKAAEYGYDLEKEWIATHDERTRISHGLLDGNRVKCKGRFSNGLEYPGDPNGAPAEVYNCRCTMRTIVPGINEGVRQTYVDWLAIQNPAPTGNDKSDSESRSMASKTNRLDDDANMYDAIGVTRGEPMDVGQALEGTNPMYSEDDMLWSYNCQRTAPTYELRRRGYDVEAREYEPDLMVSFGNELFVDSDGNRAEFELGLTLSKVKETLQSSPQGSRYIIYAQWSGEGQGAHVCNVEVYGDGFQVVDGQANDENYEDMVTEGLASQYGLLRVDDKLITDNVELIRKVCRAR